jgi:TolB-like protein
VHSLHKFPPDRSDTRQEQPALSCIIPQPMTRLPLPLLVLVGAPFVARSAAGEAAVKAVQRVAVVHLGFEGAIPEAGQEMFGQRLVQGLTVARFEVLSGATLRDRLARAGAVGCSEPRCYPATARALGVGYLVVGRVIEDSKTYQISLDLVNGRTGRILASVREQCETCGIEEAGEKMDLAASALLARLQVVTRVSARFVIRSRPAAAQARIDGEVVGRTPLEIDLAGGEHHLALQLGGHQVLSRTFIAVSGVDEILDFELLSTLGALPYRLVGWTALVAGVVAVAGGSIALAIDGREVPCAAERQDGQGHCPLVRRTDLLGAVMLGVGSAAATAGTLSLYFGSRSGPSPEPISQRPIGVALAGRF